MIWKTAAGGCATAFVLGAVTYALGPEIALATCVVVIMAAVTSLIVVAEMEDRDG